MPPRTAKLAGASAERKANKRDEGVDRRRLEDKLGFRLRMAERAIYRTFIQAIGMTPVQYSVLGLVADNEGMPQGMIGEALNLDRASTMVVMDRFEHAELVERRKSPLDRRRNAMYLTAKGQKEIAVIEQKVRRMDDEFKQRLNDRQYRELVRCLDLLEPTRSS